MRPNGAIYIYSARNYNGKIGPTVGYYMSRRDSIDIDTQDDLTVARAYLNANNRYLGSTFDDWLGEERLFDLSNCKIEDIDVSEINKQNIKEME